MKKAGRGFGARKLTRDEWAATKKQQKAAARWHTKPPIQATPTPKPVEVPQNAKSARWLERHKA